jgi:hypothetical protein
MNRQQQEKIMLLLEEISALRQSNSQSEMEVSVLTQQKHVLEQKNNVLERMVQQQQRLLSTRL